MVIRLSESIGLRYWIVWYHRLGEVQRSQVRWFDKVCIALVFSPAATSVVSTANQQEVLPDTDIPALKILKINILTTLPATGRRQVQGLARQALGVVLTKRTAKGHSLVHHLIPRQPEHPVLPRQSLNCLHVASSGQQVDEELGLTSIHT
jgi:hypothetical protein